MEVISARAFGRLEGEVKSHGDQLKELRDMMTDQTKKLDVLVARGNQQKGERRALFLGGGGIAALFGTVAGWAVTWWTSTHS